MIPELRSILDTCAVSVDPIRQDYNNYIFGSLSIENSIDEIGIGIQVYVTIL